MATVNNPTFKNPNNKELGSLPLRADETTAKKYLEENELGAYSTFESNNDNHFSNDGGQTYNYYISGETYTTYWLNTGITYEWKTEFGYYPTIKSIDHS